MYCEYLSIVLLEDIAFNELQNKIEGAIDISMSSKNEKGRLIARGVMGNMEISIIDKFDDLGDFLCDEYYTLEAKVSFEEVFDYKSLESELLSLLEKGNVKWKRGIWTKLKLFNENRVIHPHS